MAKSSVQKAICEKCSVDVRENTAYCYNCGHLIEPVSSRPESEKSNGSSAASDTKAALENLAAQFTIDETAEDDKLARAAAKRKQARIIQRKANEFEWLPVEESSSRLITLSAILVAAITLAVVFVNIIWR